MILLSWNDFTRYLGKLKKKTSMSIHHDDSFAEFLGFSLYSFHL
uniref:Uncharacterized protein n=1 Tax=Rhizophora mucronata TaxID=61149 RepID=A0A2P2QA72_RHIMU